jgi:hypothetical protein
MYGPATKSSVDMRSAVIVRPGGTSRADPIRLATSSPLRRLGVRRLTTWLRDRSVRGADQPAETAIQAADRQHTSLPGEKLTAQLVHTLAKEVLNLNQQVAELGSVFKDH